MSSNKDGKNNEIKSIEKVNKKECNHINGLATCDDECGTYFCFECNLYFYYIQGLNIVYGHAPYCEFRIKNE